MRTDDRAELRSQLGLENSAWRDAGPLSMIFCKFTFDNLHPNNYKYINVFVLELLFKQHNGIVADFEHRARWALDVDKVHLPRRLPHGFDTLHVLRTTNHEWRFTMNKLRRTNARGSRLHTWRRTLDIRIPLSRQVIFDLIHRRGRRQTATSAQSSPYYATSISKSATPPKTQQPLQVRRDHQNDSPVAEERRLKLDRVCDAFVEKHCNGVPKKNPPEVESYNNDGG